MKNKITKVDAYGVKEVNKVFLLVVFTLVTLAVWAAGSTSLYHFEYGIGNINTLGDATWTVWMAMSTIGFGDYYPVTLGGKLVVGSMFLMGAMNIGMIVGLVNAFVSGLFDKSVQNRELRKQNEHIIKQNEQIIYLLKQQSKEKAYENTINSTTCTIP